MTLIKKDIFQYAFEVIIDGVAQSQMDEERAQAGIYLAGLLIVDNKGRLDSNKIKIISSLIEMTDDVEK
ncbi:hypothetical protein L3V77_20875 [Vibrio sp. DW001]|uniref:hypothetical protein n=1 Tax=Vibrio sp. DW001 TaxID=2912315 RepID=UPI0023AFE86A|nr:hypothetical protein [Vibrio sp. DW001]WED29862.1 hypothetical protein L3V77_20875 [Vibrio sp. DW001]